MVITVYLHVIGEKPVFVRAERNRDYWTLFNVWGHTMRLPSDADLDGRTLEIGTLGTGAHGFKRKKGDPLKVEIVAQMLAALRRPLYLLDTRRDGTGAQSSWSPREFASVIPDQMDNGHPYAYLHLPCLAPSLALLNNRETSWTAFRDRYELDLSDEDRDVGRAFVEAAAKDGGLAVFLCAEPFRPDFVELSAEEQETCYCHRFTLARVVADRLRSIFAGLTIQRLDLDIIDFLQSRQESGDYIPRKVVL